MIFYRHLTDVSVAEIAKQKTRLRPQATRLILTKSSRLIALHG